jgi:hypothetical protein
MKALANLLGRWRAPARGGDPAARMSRRERALLDAARGGRPVRYVVRTGTRTDVGSWICGGRIWAAVAEGELVLLAYGKRPYTERLALADLRGTRYNALTGQLALAGVGTAAIRRLKLPPVEGRRMQAEMGC